MLPSSLGICLTSVSPQTLGSVGAPACLMCPAQRTAGTWETLRAYLLTYPSVSCLAVAKRLGARSAPSASSGYYNGPSRENQPEEPRGKSLSLRGLLSNSLSENQPPTNSQRKRLKTSKSKNDSPSRQTLPSGAWSPQSNRNRAWCRQAGGLETSIPYPRSHYPSTLKTVNFAGMPCLLLFYSKRTVEGEKQTHARWLPVSVQGDPWNISLGTRTVLKS